MSRARAGDAVPRRDIRQAVDRLSVERMLSERTILRITLDFIAEKGLGDEYPALREQEVPMSKEDKVTVELTAREADDAGRDHVRCNDCMWTGEVARGSDTCPSCGTKGALMDPPWAERETAIPQDVVERLHYWGDRDNTYRRFEKSFLGAYDQDGFTYGERHFYDPETGKTYRTWLKLEIEESEPPDVDTCPRCGEGLADALDVPDDAICEVCGWSRSGVRRCIRCGSRSDLEPDDAVCTKCRR